MSTTTALRKPATVHQINNASYSNYLKRDLHNEEWKQIEKLATQLEEAADSLRLAHKMDKSIETRHVLTTLNFSVNETVNELYIKQWGK